MPTPHNEAEKGMIAPVVLMPGDPLRAKVIAENYLKDVVMFNSVRNMFGYTGTYNNKRISVMGSGMGMPSIGIYSYELYNMYDVESIIRIGSAGAYTDKVNVGDIILVTESYSESTFAKTQSGYDKSKVYPSEELNSIICNTADKLAQSIIKGCIHSTDVFYREDKTPYYDRMYNEYGCLGVEMESFALLHNANVSGKKAACIVTVSDSFVSSEAMTADERQNSFTRMMKLALESAINVESN